MNESKTFSLTAFGVIAVHAAVIGTLMSSSIPSPIATLGFEVAFSQVKSTESSGASGVIKTISQNKGTHSSKVQNIQKKEIEHRNNKTSQNIKQEVLPDIDSPIKIHKEKQQKEPLTQAIKDLSNKKTTTKTNNSVKEHQKNHHFENRKALTDRQNTGNSINNSRSSGTASKNLSVTGTGSGTAGNGSGSYSTAGRAVILNRVQPVYPSRALKRGIQGTVVLAVTLTTNGHVASVNVHKASGSNMLDEAAMDAVKQWLFAPYLEQGIAKEHTYNIEIKFNIGN